MVMAVKHLDEYRNSNAVKRFADAIGHFVRHPWNLMEICGGQTHTILKYGLDELLPKSVTLIHGPGCPVCVTDSELIDRAQIVAEQPDVILCSFGDMLRVPGNRRDLLSVRAAGADIRTVYSPLDAVAIAGSNPNKQIVFFAVGFETTAPAVAIAVKQARDRNVENFSILSAHVLVPPALELILLSPHNRVNGVIAAGHVCTVMGWREYEPIAARYHIPIVVTGFEPLDLMQGIHMCLQQLEQGRAEVENQYARSVRPEGNIPAQALMREVFKVVPRKWRGIGEIPASGLGLSDAYRAFDAELRFAHLKQLTPPSSPPQAGGESAQLEAGTENICIAGLVLQGARKPSDCPAFGSQCIPEHPLGAPMVSSEGACAAYFRYRRERGDREK